MSKQKSGVNWDLLQVNDFDRFGTWVWYLRKTSDISNCFFKFSPAKSYHHATSVVDIFTETHAENCDILLLSYLCIWMSLRSFGIRANTDELDSASFWFIMFGRIIQRCDSQ